MKKLLVLTTAVCASLLFAGGTAASCSSVEPTYACLDCTYSNVTCDACACDADSGLPYCAISTSWCKDDTKRTHGLFSATNNPSQGKRTAVRICATGTFFNQVIFAKSGNAAYVFLPGGGCDSFHLDELDWDPTMPVFNSGTVIFQVTPFDQAVGKIQIVLAKTVNGSDYVGYAIKN